MKRLFDEWRGII